MCANPMSRGKLRNGNPQGDLDRVPRCHAHRRDGGPCRQPAMRGRAVCRLHGGKGGAPRGRRNGAWRHGGRSREFLALLAMARARAKKLKAAIDAAKAQHSRSSGRSRAAGRTEQYDRGGGEAGGIFDAGSAGRCREGDSEIE